MTMTVLMRLRPLVAGLLAAPLLALATSPEPSSSLSDYAFKPARAPVGRVVHYVKSNLDGSKRLVLSMHFSAPLMMEVLKVEADGQYLALVQAELDPATLSESRMKSFNGLETGSRRQQMALEPDPRQRRLVAEVANTRMPVTPGHWPAHIYNFDLSGLNATLPHLKDPRRDFEVGLIDPDFQFLKTGFKPDAGEVAGGFVYKGKARFRFVRDEVLDEIPCHRFEVGGPAFKNIKGTLWINAKDGLIERFEHVLPDNPDWKSFRLSRISSRPMNDAEWEAFKAATVRRAMDLRDGR
ncbi:MAG TPA: hypothetical protein VFY73_23755 [Ideonella sp.]|uniref:hypothetical protein n=1 Tax=Ideonella sp. TaxID=1929293 RepID=UPI002E30B738|nr:hypothetical protein [Ideonella sp.]HEX5687040.1 hypothetical protein [Ideonella sp.]